MRRSALALLGLLALPAAATAQTGPLLGNEPPPERLPEARFAITPYIGVRVPYNTGGYVVLTDAGDQFSVREERGGATMVGADLEARLRGPVSLVLGGAFATAEQDILTILDTADETLAVQTDGPAMWKAKAGVRVRLPDPVPDNRRFHPSAFITVAPAMVWMDWEDIEGAPDAITGSTRHFALNLAADATTRIGRNGSWALQLGVEDYLTFWDADAIRVRDEALGPGRFGGDSVLIDYDYSQSNILALRLGVSYRFR